MPIKNEISGVIYTQDEQEIAKMDNAELTYAYESVTTHPAINMSFSGSFSFNLNEGDPNTIWKMLCPQFKLIGKVPYRRCVWKRNKSKWYRHFKTKKVESVVKIGKW